jgi:hypothetical protein
MLVDYIYIFPLEKLTRIQGYYIIVTDVIIIFVTADVAVTADRLLSPPPQS